MSRFIQRIQSYLATPAQAQEKISHLLIELRHRGMTFDISLENEDGQKFFYAKSINYPNGYITATGSTMEQLESELKDAIFTAFEVPARFCIPELIVFNSPISQVATENKKVYATT